MIKKLERKRIITNIFKYLSIISTILIIVCFYFAIINNDTSKDYSLYYILFITALIFNMVIYKITMSNYIDDYKDYFVNKLKEYFDEAEYLKYNNLDISDLLKAIGLNNTTKVTHFFPIEVYKRRLKEQDDFFSGKYKNISFRQYHLRIRIITGDLIPPSVDQFYRRLSYDTINGIITEIDMDLCKIPLLINSKMFWLNVNYDNVKINDKDFEERFPYIESEDSDLALKFLNKKNIDKLLDFSNNLISKEYAIFFYNEKVYIIQNKFMPFNPNLNVKVNEKKSIEEIIRNTYYIKKFIDLFKGANNENE